MICWRCGKKLTEHASNCAYCNTSQNRIVPKTEAGKAMRRIYDHFGPQEILISKHKLSVGLGDMLSDSKKLRRQIEAAFDAGIGRFYLNQLEAVGKADVNFNARIKKLLAADADMSDKAAEDIMKYMDEMIGWQAAGVQSSSEQEKRQEKDPAERYREEKDRQKKLDEERKRKEEERKREEQRKRDEEKKRREEEQQKKTDYPKQKLPENPGTTYMILTIVMLIISIATFNPVCIAIMLLCMVLYFTTNPKGTKHIKIYNKGNGNYSCEWDMPLEKWAMAVDGKWVAAGEGKGKSVSFTCHKLPVDICICSVDENAKFPLTLKGKVTLNANNTMSE